MYQMKGPWLCEILDIDRCKLFFSEQTLEFPAREKNKSSYLLPEQ